MGRGRREEERGRKDGGGGKEGRRVRRRTSGRSMWRRGARRYTEISKNRMTLMQDVALDTDKDGQKEETTEGQKWEKEDHKDRGYRRRRWN